MRRFVIVGHNVDPEGDFALNDLCGGAGRLDVLLRCVSSAFFLSHGLRKEVEVFLVLPGQRSQSATGQPERGGHKTVRFCGRELRYLNPDERSTGALVRTALLRKLDGNAEKPSTPGIYVSRTEFDVLANTLPNPVWLTENGEPWPAEGLPPDSTFYLSDHHDFSPREEEALKLIGARRTSLGPSSLHSHHCITVVHWLMDRPDEGPMAGNGSAPAAGGA
jgi:tRNA (pseudouridine54-N1)-methyltransferase